MGFSLDDLNPLNWLSKGAKFIGKQTGLTSPASDAENADLNQMRQFRDAMLAAAQNRMANPLPAPQLGAPSWAGIQSVAGPGTTVGGSPVTPGGGVGMAGPAGRAPGTAFVGAPPAVPPGNAPGASNMSPEMTAQLKRIQAQKMLAALLSGGGGGIGNGGLGG